MHHPSTTPKFDKATAQREARSASEQAPILRVHLLAGTSWDARDKAACGPKFKTNSTHPRTSDPMQVTCPACISRMAEAVARALTRPTGAVHAPVGLTPEARAGNPLCRPWDTNWHRTPPLIADGPEAVTCKHCRKLLAGGITP